MARAAINNFPELDIPNLESLFTEIQYPKDYEIIKSSKDKDATLFNGYYYNFSRKNSNKMPLHSNTGRNK